MSIIDGHEVEGNQKPQEVNRHRINVDINGTILNQDLGCRITYSEIADYWNMDFPARILEISCPYQFTQIILNKKVELVNGRQMYDINLLVIPVESGGFKNKAINDGAFKAILKENDGFNKFEEELTPDNRILEEKGGVTKGSLRFYLYREEELQYSQTKNINFLKNNPTLSECFLTAFNVSNPTLKAVVSRFDHDPTLGMYLIPPMGFVDVMDVLENDVGFYRTELMDFIEHGVYFLLNRENEFNVSNQSLEFFFNINVARSYSDRTDKYIKKINERTYETSTPSSSVDIRISNSKSFNTSVNFITPSGVEYFHERGLSRNIDTVRKLSEVEPIKKIPNPIYELVTINLTDSCVNWITPLTKLVILDTLGNPRTYRMCKKTIKVDSGFSTESELVGFRLIENGNKMQ